MINITLEKILVNEKNHYIYIPTNVHIIYWELSEYHIGICLGN